MNLKANRSKVAIVAASISREDAPYDDLAWEIWACNEMDLPRYDVMFELHPLTTEVQNEREIEFLRSCERPVYVLSKKDALKMGIKEPIEYPLNDILKQPWAINYWTCTMTYQIALAIYKGFKTIGLWGLRMDLGSPRERTIESAAIQAWLGIAKGKGIEVIWNEHPAMNRFRYGYDYFEEIKNIDDWLYKLAIHIIYRLGSKYINVGGDDMKIRQKNLDGNS